MSASPLAPEALGYPADANELLSTVWPASANRDEDGALRIGGLSTRELVAEHGTPLYLLDEDEVRSRARRISGAFADAFAPIGAATKTYYAGKAFLSTEIVRWMRDEGLFIDVCSGGELAVALAGGADPARLGFHGNNKSLAEIDRAVEVGVGAIVIDSITEIDRVADAAGRHRRVQPVRLRINSGVHASTHEFLATAREDQKFGIPVADAPAAVARIRSHAGLRFLGLHSHIGSQIFESAGFAEAARRLVALHAALLADGEVPELNLGGGFGIAYTGADAVTPIEEIAADFADVIRASCAEAGVDVPTIAIEPGRYIVGPAGITVYEVGTIKDVVVSLAPTTERESADATPARSAVRRYVSVDGGMSDNARPVLYQARYTARLANRASAADPTLVRVAGKHCESGDIVVDAEYLPGDVAPGDLLAVPATGAYCWSLASNYNYLARPGVVAVRGGSARVIVRRETERDLLRRDVAFAADADKGRSE